MRRTRLWARPCRDCRQTAWSIRRNPSARCAGGRPQFFRKRGAAKLLAQLFSRKGMPAAAMGSREASEAFVRGQRELVPLREAGGRIALEAAAAYPPGICVPAAGERWEASALAWFTCLLDFGEEFPAFAPELHGVHQKENGAFVWVYRP